MSDTKPDCYKCKHRGELLVGLHSTCANREAKVTANAHGIKSGWFFWPYNFDPVWLVSCDGFAPREAMGPQR